MGLIPKIRNFTLLRNTEPKDVLSESTYLVRSEQNRAHSKDRALVIEGKRAANPILPDHCCYL